ncbi:Uncharacterised protein [Pseudomonas aeruginosa]|nr:Uncharacterised protein [Pseudomonas aeruginosa]
MGTPVVGGRQAFQRMQASADAGHQRYPRLAETDLADYLAETLEHGLGRGTVEGVGNRELAGPHLHRREFFQQHFDVRFRTGDNQVLGTVHRRQLDTRQSLLAQQPEQFRFTEVHGMHHPSGGHQFLGQASARLDHPQGVLQREGPGDTGGANFTETVTEQRAGEHAPGHPQAGQRVFHGENRRLRIACLRQQRLCLRRRLEQGAGQLDTHPAQRHETLVQCLTERQLAVVQRPGHSRILAALAGKQPGGCRRHTRPTDTLEGIADQLPRSVGRQLLA